MWGREGGGFKSYTTLMNPTEDFASHHRPQGRKSASSPRFLTSMFFCLFPSLSPPALFPAYCCVSSGGQVMLGPEAKALAAAAQEDLPEVSRGANCLVGFCSCSQSIEGGQAGVKWEEEKGGVAVCAYRGGRACV